MSMDRKETFHMSDESHAVAHPIRGRINAWLFQRLDGYMDQRLGDIKRELFADLPDEVVEIGAGTGANLRYFRPGTRVRAVEPSPFMREKLLARARRFAIDVEVRGLVGEALDLPSDSADAVLSTLVLCSVTDPAAVLSEVRRVLRPGGRFLCIEHVVAPESTFIRRIQKWVKRPWRWFFEGCHTDRDLEGALRSAGFSNVRVDQLYVPTLFLPIRTQIRAIAVK
jgi:SAM-dependent methyltransferase